LSQIQSISAKPGIQKRVLTRVVVSAKNILNIKIIIPSPRNGWPLASWNASSMLVLQGIMCMLPFVDICRDVLSWAQIIHMTHSGAKRMPKD